MFGGTSAWAILSLSLGMDLSRAQEIAIDDIGENTPLSSGEPG
jgi:hypothetical protein